MRISTGPLPYTPRRLEPAQLTPPAAPALSALRKHPMIAMSTKGLYGFDISAQRSPNSGGDTTVEILRVVCDFIAARCGGKTLIVNKVVWLSLDVMNLVETAKDNTVSGLAKSTAAMQVASGVLDLASMVPALSGLEKGVLPLYFSADIGDRIETGRCEVTVSDLVAYADDPQAALQKLAELVK